MSSERSTLKLHVSFFLLLSVIHAYALTDITHELFGTEYEGIISAFGDFNADKATDIFLLSSDGKSLSILVAKMDFDIRRDEVKYVQKKIFSLEYEMTSVVPGDFNGDSQMDVLVTTRQGGAIKVQIFAGEGDTLADTPFLVANESFKDQPEVIDWNGDMVPDLFGELASGKRAVWLFTKSGEYTLKEIEDSSGESLAPLKTPQSSAFLDLDGDMTADLCVAVTSDDNPLAFEFWLNRKGTLVKEEVRQGPSELKVAGQATFADFNGNHEMNIVLPGCLDTACKEPAVFVNTWNKYSNLSEWVKLDINFKISDDHYTYFNKDMSLPGSLSWLKVPPISLRFGDFNLDGHPDAIAVLSETFDNGKSATNSSTFLLINKPCSSCGSISRTLEIDFSKRLHKYNPIVSSFFDIIEDGALDILASERDPASGKVMVRAIKQDFSADANFLKVLVTSGHCFQDCPKDHKPYGVNQVGPTARFESTNPEGGDQIGVSSQLFQSAYFSLQLPFMLFGLGRTPNFIDHLEVGITRPPEAQAARRHSWSSIIPNSHVIIVPHPHEYPGSWSTELYVTPSRLVLLTGVSLLGTCAFIAIIIGLLQWRERVEDKKEKLQEAQRFHFDAM